MTNRSTLVLLCAVYPAFFAVMVLMQIPASVPMFFILSTVALVCLVGVYYRTEQRAPGAPEIAPVGSDLQQQLPAGWRHQDGAGRLYLVNFVVEAPDGRRILCKHGCRVITGLRNGLVATADITELLPRPPYGNP